MPTRYQATATQNTGSDIMHKCQATQERLDAEGITQTSRLDPQWSCFLVKQAKELPANMRCHSTSLPSRTCCAESSYRQLKRTDPKFLQSQGHRLGDSPVGAQARALDMSLLVELTEGEVAESIGVDQATEKDMEGEDDLLCEYLGSRDSQGGKLRAQRPGLIRQGAIVPGTSTALLVEAAIRRRLSKIDRLTSIVSSHEEARIRASRQVGRKPTNSSMR
ncbi:uncharacterized protein FTJAE_8191 [Fusarium tjaetaba]|uniref:Uncharacterized protein n=1 Tax=Fusarium tjaetaba TaxID=1567544 RepID=A0A8H5RBX9_9HYPO|nr:uncharacterized protein FTJAE_8191 [Fusarium tjaetaba]KAF5630429.1 hypothetical protein FTJAE_8191 [Fusarium tjaetaba]